MNELVIIGNITKDPESRTTQSGKQVVTFTVAVNRRGDKDKSDFFRVSVWGESGANCMKYLGKGKKVGVTGSVSASAYKAQDGSPRASLEVSATSVEFLSPKDEGQQAPHQNVPKGFVQVEDQLPF
jgi:single-strand DNA-binding protein